MLVVIRKKGMVINMNNEQNTQEMSHSQAKRLARKKEIAQQKKDNAVNNLIIYGIIVVVLLVIIGGIGTSIYKAATKIAPSSDYSAKLADNGFIKGVNASSQLELCNYKGIEVPLSEIEYTDEEMQNAINSQLSAHQVLSTDEELVTEDGNKINIAFVGTIDGEEFEGGSAESYDLTLGSGMFIEGFEEQLVGKKNGEEVTVNVTFPEDYGKEELNGKDAVFAVTINGIYTNPEFDDAFVKENLSAYADTVDAYKTYLKETNEQSRKIDWLDQYLQDNTNVKSYPKSYLRNMKCVKMYDDQQSYEMINSYYESAYGSKAYNSFSEYVQMDDAAYQVSVATQSMEQLKAELIYQAILETEGVTVTVDDVKANEGDTYDNMVETYGAGFVAKDYIKNKALEIVTESAVVK